MKVGYARGTRAVEYVIAKRKEMGNPMCLQGRTVECVADVLGEWDGETLKGGWINT